MATPPDPDDPPPVEPLMPDLDDCCGQGCDPCVFDVHDAARQRWLAALRAWQARHAADAAAPDGGDAAAT